VQDLQAKSRRVVAIVPAMVWLVLGGIAGAQSDLVADGAMVEKLAGGFIFTEGPAVDAHGNVFFSDIRNNRVHKWSADGKLSTFRENSGGTNGNFFDRQGNLIGCEGTARRITSTTPEGKVTALVDAYQGKKLNSPNDLWIDPDGGIYFSDPRYGDESGLEQDGFHVYYLTAGDHAISRVIDDLVKPNGVLGTADGKYLYVADAGDSKTYRYEITGPGKLANRKLAAAQGSDGMTLDEQGHLYLTSATGVAIYDDAGRQIGSIATPERPANLVFGGEDLKTLFITARTSFYAVKMKVAGQRRDH